MSLVLDCSVTIAWCVDEERTPAVLGILDRVIGEGAVVPGIWRYEVANALLVAERRRRLDPARREHLLGELSTFDIRVDAETDERLWGPATRLADRHDLTVYDASYLELAMRRRVPLATHDRKLRRAAESEGVALA